MASGAADRKDVTSHSLYGGSYRLRVDIQQKQLGRSLRLTGGAGS